MITFICCSVRPTEVELLKENITNTIGNVPFEFIAFDNRELSYGLCKVYNICAQKARYEYLCFLHEDVKFSTENWGYILINKLAVPTTGVVGFAGCSIKLNYPTGWYATGMSTYANYIQHFKHRRRKPDISSHNPNNEDFSRVVTLDGMCLFVRRDVWAECRFDDAYFTGFHCYDVDFALTVSLKYHNYVCQCVLLEHFSEGSFNKSWAKDNSRMHDKWTSHLPLMVDEIPEDKLQDYIAENEINGIKCLLRSKGLDGYGYPNIFKLIKKYPSRLMPWLFIFKNIKYRLKSNN